MKAQNDSVGFPYPQMLFNSPENFDETVEYSAENRSFTFQKSVGSLNLQRPTFMSESAYKQWLFNQQIQNYWRQKVQPNLFNEDLDGTRPKRQIGGESISRIFGGNTVDIRPQGAAELTFSGNVDKTKNPNLTQSQQSNASFNFDQSIQMNVIGKIGTKLTMRTNYDTKSQFDFENQMKLEYTGDEDEIIKKIELGNVSLPLSGSLISGTQSLFGIKMQLQFGKATFTSVFSEQKSETSTIRVDGGAQTTNFEIYADDYEANKHFFLAQYFYDNYDKDQITKRDKEDYNDFMEDLSDEERDLVNENDHFYSVKFSDNGGIIMPIILEFEYEDGEKEVIRIPVEIWRFNRGEVTKVFKTEKPIKNMTLDPFFQIDMPALFDNINDFTFCILNVKE